MNITAADVNKLRTMTGAGMMDCKKALTEAEGDFELAVELLRKKGQKVAASRGDRDATEGVVLAKSSADNTGGYIIVLNCETDFVAKNEGFVSFATAILDTAIANNANRDRKSTRLNSSH
jgi:elongation factor Ts